MSQELMCVAQPAAPPTLPAAAPSSPPPTSLAPGFRFHPTDEELVRYYLRRKACGKPFRFEAVSEIDVYKSEPWELADYSSLKTRDLEWYFFSPVDRKYGNGSRLNRATGRGYWKATGKDRPVRHKSEMIGMKKTLVFHSGRAPDGQRTNWVMHEYRLLDQELERAGVVQDAFVLCRIFQKSGLGPPNGDRYAPFIEEEWDDDATLMVPGGETEDDMTTGDEAQAQGNDFVQEVADINVPYRSEGSLMDHPETIPFVCKRERAEGCVLNRGPAELQTFSLFHNKRPKQSALNANGSNGNGSEDSTTSQDPRTTKVSSALMEFPLLQSLEAKESYPSGSQPSFDSSTLEKSVPPGYLKFIHNLENEILNVSMERETLKIEVMRAQAMINILQAKIGELSRENDELKRGRAGNVVA
ncbi:NAC domain containing protein 52-like [Cynara cardunculus var. scolymus]|uniref:NAC domain containing protein 52-like n=1 Tax=Cynara cardunculus var. scolymus TaxID=59895 RepID=UPI000D62A823|nr:NAC domain containing protein 52-like [Cynara cardunculus var. scolymus]XP_024978958.1 NAC domain containing protein 52-like [Cynara cardunculus var. scolymus]